MRLAATSSERGLTTPERTYLENESSISTTSCRLFCSTEESKPSFIWLFDCLKIFSFMFDCLLDVLLEPPCDWIERRIA